MAQNGNVIHDEKAMNGFISNGTCKPCKETASKHAGTCPSRFSAEEEEFLRDLFEIIVKDAVKGSLNPDSKVVDFKHPQELEGLLDLEIDKMRTSNENLLKISEQVIKYSVKSGHPHFFNQLFGGYDTYGLAGAWLTEVLNTSQYTFEVAPVFTLMEKTVLGKMGRIAGFHEGDGIFCPGEHEMGYAGHMNETVVRAICAPLCKALWEGVITYMDQLYHNRFNKGHGGSISNLYAINLARFHKFPTVKTEGMAGLPKMCLFTSEEGHYSMKKSAATLGLGMNSVVPVKCDACGRMQVDALEKEIIKSIENGIVPIMVNVTSGTTVLGAYDPLDAIGDVCRKYGIWMHCDGAWGAGCLLSKKLRYLMKGIEKADSLTWNPHKMMGSPLQTCAFLTRHKTILAECHSAKAQYLFQQDKFYDVSYDTGDKSIQCGRKVDVLKLWMMWKAKGDNQFAKDIENIFDCARYLTEKLKNTEGFKLVLSEPECTNVGFWYIPPSLRGQKETKEWWEKVAKVAPEIKKRMTEQGTLLIGYQPDREWVNFFRMVVSNTATTHTEMDFVVSEIDRLGHDL